MTQESGARPPKREIQISEEAQQFAELVIQKVVERDPVLPVTVSADKSYYILSRMAVRHFYRAEHPDGLISVRTIYAALSQHELSLKPEGFDQNSVFWIVKQ